MLAELRKTLRTLEQPARGRLLFGIGPIDTALGGGLTRGALHEIAAAGEAHVSMATGFALALSSLSPSSPRAAGKGGRGIVWIATEMALAESGAPYGPGLNAFGLAPEQLVTIATAHTHDLLWAMEEALRCRAVGAVIGELRHEEVDSVAVRRLSLAAGQSGALAILLRASPPHDASTAATRWIVSAACNDAFAVRLTRNRRGVLDDWTLQWSDEDECFVPTTHAQPVAAPAADRPHRQVA